MAKNKREPISLKTRIEVFKRDSFTCQYCGRHAPDVVLELDHIKPVAKGGTNDIMNLITSCFECNRGKGKRELNDSSVLDKQHNQLRLMQEKRNQLQMVMEWKEGLIDILNEQIDYFSRKLYELTDRSFTPEYNNRLGKCLKKVGFDIVFDSFEICVNQYYNEDNNVMAKNIAKNLIGIAYNLYDERNNPQKASLRYIANILKNNCSYFDYKKFYAKMNEFIYSTIDEKEIMSFANTSNSMNNFFKKVEEYYES